MLRSPRQLVRQISWFVSEAFLDRGNLVIGFTYEAVVPEFWELFFLVATFSLKLWLYQVMFE